MRKGLSLYIHIPFCNSKCNYCSFTSFVSNDEIKDRYVSALKKEIAIRGKELSAQYEVTTIYIGGGTPSSLPGGLIKSIMQEVYKHFVVINNAEITIEVNPNTLTKEKVSEYMFAGINRVSMGLQCASKTILEKMGRTHTLDDFLKSVQMLREQGLNNISADVILGYPEETLTDVKLTIELLLKLGIPHISTYMLSVEEGTPLSVKLNHKTTQLPEEETVVSMYNYCVDRLTKAGFERYEVSNFAKPGFRSKHNEVYWKRYNYLGLGLAAHSFLKHQRFSNTKDLPAYITYIESNGDVPVVEAKKLTKEEEKEEWIMLMLRRSDGLDVDAYKKEFGENLFVKKKNQLAMLIKNGLIIINTQTNHIIATNKGFLVLNKIIETLV
ncbi:MAG: radical SAM family heme chaperone HemW [Clostridia bacterium]|nr:radical SAM family heme chaperone HemW [Clostridia bacterium]